MNSTPVAPVAIQTAGELIRFQHPDEWRSRPKYQSTVDFAVHAPLRIVGGYDLAKELYQNCGLVMEGALCNTEHGHGFVVETVDGLETQIGKDCGRRHVGAKFEELERQFRINLDAQDRMKRLRELLVQKGAMIARARQAIQDCDRADATIATYKHKIGREPSLLAAFNEALSSDGQVFFNYKASEDEFAISRQRFRREVVARIDGVAAAASRSPKTQIQDVVLQLLHSLTEESLSRLSGRQLLSKSKEANEASSILVDADAYVALSKRFTARANWRAFEAAFGTDRHKTNERGHRILAQLIEMSSE